MVLSLIAISTLSVVSAQQWEAQRANCQVFEQLQSGRWEALPSGIAQGQQVVELETKATSADLLYFQTAPGDPKVFISWKECFRKIDVAAAPTPELAPVPVDPVAPIPAPEADINPNAVPPAPLSLESVPLESLPPSPLPLPESPPPPPALPEARSKSSSEFSWSNFGKRSIAPSLGMISWSEEVRARLNSGESPKLTANALGIVVGATFYQRWIDFIDLGWSLSGGLAKGQINDHNDVAGFDYNIRNASSYFVMTGPSILFRPFTQNIAFGPKALMVYRTADWDEGATYSVSDKTAFFLTGALEARMEWNNFTLAQNLGFFRAFQSLYWSFELSYSWGL